MVATFVKKGEPKKQPLTEKSVSGCLFSKYNSTYIGCYFGFK